MTFACIIPAMFLSEFELVPNIVILRFFTSTQPSHEWLASTSLQLYPSFHTLTHWHRSANELHVVTQASSALLLVSAAASSEYFSISSILESALSFHLCAMLTGALYTSYRFCWLIDNLLHNDFVEVKKQSYYYIRS